MIIHNLPFALDLSEQQREHSGGVLGAAEVVLSGDHAGVVADEPELIVGEGELAHRFLVGIGLAVALKGVVPAAGNLCADEHKGVGFPVAFHEACNVPIVPVYFLAEE